MKQLEEYEEAVMRKRLAEMPEEDVERLMREVRPGLYAGFGPSSGASVHGRVRVRVAQSGDGMERVL